MRTVLLTLCCAIVAAAAVQLFHNAVSAQDPVIAPKPTRITVSAPGEITVTAQTVPEATYSAKYSAEIKSLLLAKKAGDATQDVTVTRVIHFNEPIQARGGGTERLYQEDRPLQSLADGEKALRSLIITPPIEGIGVSAVTASGKPYLRFTQRCLDPDSKPRDVTVTYDQSGGDWSIVYSLKASWSTHSVLPATCDKLNAPSLNRHLILRNQTAEDWPACVPVYLKDAPGITLPVEPLSATAASASSIVITPDTGRAKTVTLVGVFTGDEAVNAKKPVAIQMQINIDGWPAEFVIPGSIALTVDSPIEVLKHTVAESDFSKAREKKDISLFRDSLLTVERRQDAAAFAGAEIVQGQLLVPTRLFSVTNQRPNPRHVQLKSGGAKCVGPVPLDISESKAEKLRLLPEFGQTSQDIEAYKKRIDGYVKATTDETNRRLQCMLDRIILAEGQIKEAKDERSGEDSVIFEEAFTPSDTPLDVRLANIRVRGEVARNRIQQQQDAWNAMYIELKRILADPSYCAQRMTASQLH